MSLTVETIGDADAFELLAAEWDELVLAQPRPSPFLLHAWLLEWIRHYGETGAVSVHIARRCP
jgi:hypothetical protein